MNLIAFISEAVFINVYLPDFKKYQTFDKLFLNLDEIEIILT